jgi:predicted nuclease with RNAse H fold
VSAPLVAGVDLAAGRGTTAVAMMRVEVGAPRPALTGLHLCGPDDEALLDLLARMPPRVVALDAPLSLPAAVRAGLGSAAGQGRRDPHPSPYTRAAERDPLWTSLGVRPLPVSFLGGLTFRAIALLPRLRARLPGAALIEAFPSGALRCLGIDPPATGSRRRARKTSEATRTTVQHGLCAWISAFPSPERELLTRDELDAAAAALTAVAYLRGEYRAIGDVSEGQIILPRVCAPFT